MDLLERAGLAGLYLALKAARKAGHDLSPLTWDDADLTSNSVTVRWTGPAKQVFVKLMQWVWQVKDGVFFFPAVHDQKDVWWQREALHNGLMKTYFQNPNVQPALEPIERVVEIEPGVTVQVRFKVPGERVEAPELGVNKRGKPQTKTVPTQNLKPHRDTDEKLFDAAGAWITSPIILSNWVYPGIAPRFTKVEEAWVGVASRALLLMLTPTVCLFQRLQGEGGNWVLVVPDVRDLRAFAQARGRIALKPDFIDVASLGDAGLRFLAEYTTGDVAKKLHAGCRVIAMGNVNYYQNQSIRKSVLDVTDKRDSVARYRVLQQVFPNHFQRINRTPPDASLPADGKKKPKPRKPPRPADEGPQPTGWYKLPTGRGRIADNLVSGRPWYERLFVPMPWDEKAMEQQRKQSDKGTSTERVWFQALTYQRSKLMRLIQEDIMWDSEAEKLFVQAFWETLDSLYAQEAEAKDRGGSRSIEDRFEHLNEDIRRRLMQAKTRVLLRGALAEWFAKAGRQKTFRTYTAAFWRLIDHPDYWQQGRDLALVALASYRRRAVREGKEPESAPIKNEENA
ncbi:MAG TPA: type I-MYXAN CRISPR-associated Cas8a1/Cmx1, partial [Urbifossiella sp.]|jgi:CRISPR-associated protein Cas8a1/Csx13|nr:type I-MYXAN CRISPR-associated Cas8a1/Cmx1 [Urbifossiella sp.]